MNIRTRSAVMWLAGINVALFLLQLVIPRLTENFMLVSADIYTRPWILITHMFLHGGFMHLLINMWVLVMFGRMMETNIGWKRFLILYFGSGITAGVLSSFFYSASLGASGAIMGVVAALIVFMPNLKVMILFLPIPMPFWIAGILFVAWDLFGVYNPSGTGNIAHLVGFAFGLAYGYILTKSKRKFNKTFSTTKTHMNKKDIDEYLKKRF
ncbi:rhomboid family intramembrane serine protease [Bacteroidota bacterium]